MRTSDMDYAYDGDQVQADRDEAEYQKGIADGERYQAEKAIYGAALADRFQAEDEWNRFWRDGEDYY